MGAYLLTSDTERHMFLNYKEISCQIKTVFNFSIHHNHLRSLKMKITSGIFITLCIIALAGCGISESYYTWNEYGITNDKWTPRDYFKDGQKIRLIEGEADNSETLFLSIGRARFYGNMQILTHGLVEHLALELRKKNMEVSDTAEKTMEIIVDSSNYEKETFKFVVILNYTVKFGNDKQKSFTIRNSSYGNIYRTYNGAVALAVIQIIKDPEVKQYLNE